MRAAVTAFFVLVSLAISPATAKEFRYYYGMQWVVTPTENIPPPMLIAEGDSVIEARMLTADLFETTSGAAFEGKAVFGKGSQFATAVSSQAVRCSLGRGEPGTLSATRRVCLTDDDKDGIFDHYFDIGLGQGGLDVQFTGCIPKVRFPLKPVTMQSVAPDTLRDPMMFRVKLNKINGRKIRSKDGTILSISNPFYEFGGSIGRNDRIWNYYSFCGGGSCRMPPQITMVVEVEGIALRVLGQEGPKARVEVLRNLTKRNYWDMSRGHRPDPIYECPGTWFVETDVLTF